MITITLKEVDYNLKTSASDFSLGEYESILTIINSTDEDFEKYANLLVSVGLPIEVVDNLEIKDFMSVLKQFTQSFDDISQYTSNFSKTIEIGNKIYTSYTDDEFKLKVKELKLIEKFITRNPNAYLSEIIAVVFKDNDLTNTEHYTDAHIRHKAKLFREHVTLDIALPYIIYFSKEILNNITVEINLNDSNS